MRKDDIFVKICGITNLDDAGHAHRAGADAIGFNFYPASPRYLVPERAAAIGAAISRNVLKVGVFVNSPLDEIGRIAEEAGLDAVQLHGNETDESINRLRELLPANMQIIKAVQSTLDHQSGANALLIDAAGPEFGGSGRRADWNVARKLVDDGMIVYLAGGLDAGNVREAIRRVRPFAVDACSRLERRPGIKDPRKVAAFIMAAKEGI